MKKEPIVKNVEIEIIMQDKTQQVFSVLSFKEKNLIKDKTNKNISIANKGNVTSSCKNPINSPSILKKYAFRNNKRK